MPKKKIQKNLPIYEIVIDPNDQTTGVKMVSLLSDPAIEVQGMYFAKPKRKWGLVTPPCHFADPPFNTNPNCQCDIIYNPLIGDHEWVLGPEPCEFCIANKTKWDDLNSRFSSQKFSAIQEQKVVAGPALIPNKKIFRVDEETGDEYYVVFSKEVIAQIVQKFNKGNNNRSINLDHTNTMAPAYIQESWIIADSVYDKSKALGYDLPVGTWFICVKIEDDNFWNTEIKELGKYSFSIEGMLGQKLLEFALKKAGIEEDLFENLTDTELIELANEILKITKV